MKYQALIFDFDYTLGDSTPGIVASVNYAMAQLGLPPFPEEQIRKTVGLSLTGTYNALSGDGDEQNAIAFASYFKEEADRVMASNTVLLPGVEDVLMDLRSRPVKLGIVTTKFHRRIVETWW